MWQFLLGRWTGIRWWRGYAGLGEWHVCTVSELWKSVECRLHRSWVGVQRRVNERGRSGFDHHDLEYLLENSRAFQCGSGRISTVNNPRLTSSYHRETLPLTCGDALGKHHVYIPDWRSVSQKNKMQRIIFKFKVFFFSCVFILQNIPPPVTHLHFISHKTLN